jgi:hypothetical protein
MGHPTLYPLEDEQERLSRHCKLPIHFGQATIRRFARADEDHPFSKLLEEFRKRSPGIPCVSQAQFDASFVVPAAGDCLIFLHGPAAVGLSRNFGEQLTITGECADGPFRFECPQFYVDAIGTDGSTFSWAIARPINDPATITYGDSRPPARALATINNFDFESGNVATDDANSPENRLLRILAAGRTVDFKRRAGYEPLKVLLRTGVLRSTALSEFSFTAWEGASESELSTFAHNVAGLCGLVAKQHTGVPVLTFQDECGHPVKRVLGSVLESPFREDYVLRFLHFDYGLPKLFEQCFDEYVRLMASELWRRLPSFCAVIDDAPYLEQRCATLMAGLELLLRSSLGEANYAPQKQLEKMKFSELLGAARSKLGWQIPGHYNAKDRARLLRNAVSHGGPLPDAPSCVVADLQKWSLFLMRRMLMRLGFDGKIASPENGWKGSSQVNDFSQERNSFEG